MWRLGVLALSVVAACARPPAPLRGTFPPLTVRDAQADGPLGTRVRWGGEIVDTRPGRDETCFEVVSKSLDGSARPRAGDETFGRFVACARGFYDPAVYEPGRELTATGTLAEPTTRAVGEYEYRFPVVRADMVYLWPKREPRSVYYYRDPWLDPFWGPYPYWGWGGGFVVPFPDRSPRPRPRR